MQASTSSSTGGVLASAREVLLGFHADVRISVLVPDGERWVMSYQAGHNLASQKRYTELIDDTLAGGVLRGGEALHVPDVTEQRGFKPNPHATRPFRCMSSVLHRVPRRRDRSGDEHADGWAALIRVLPSIQ
jgi:hypothetical protein